MLLAANASTSARSKLGFIGFTMMAVLAATQLGASCVDGVTPDCSDPVVCAPNAGGSRDADVVSEGGGGGGSDSSVADGGHELDADTSADADTDGG